MGEWLLLLAVNIASGTPGDPRDVSLTTVGGFTSKAACETAAQTIAMRVVSVVGQARMQAGLQGNGNRSTPVLNYECVFQEVKRSLNLTKALYLFVDTNLFLQCRSLEQLDWSPMGQVDAIELVLIDNSAAERALRGVALGRGNYLLMGSNAQRRCTA